MPYNSDPNEVIDMNTTPEQIDLASKFILIKMKFQDIKKSRKNSIILKICTYSIF